jgi:hypothetical protein
MLQMKTWFEAYSIMYSKINYNLEKINVKGKNNNLKLHVMNKFTNIFFV